MAINLVIALNFLLFFGVNSARVVFSLYALELGASPSGVGGIIALLYLFPLLLSWPIGVLADRYGSRWLLVFGAASGGAGMLGPFFVHALPALYVAAALAGLTVAFTSVLGQNLIGILSTPGNRTKNFSNYSLVGSLCNFAGPLFAGLVIDHAGGHAMACLGIAVILFLGIGMLLVWGHSLPGGRAPRGRPGNLLATLGDRSLWRMLAISGLSQLGNDLFMTFLPIYAHGLGLSATVIGIVVSALAVGAFGIRIFLPRLIALLGQERLLSLSFYFGALGFALVPLTSDALLLGLISVGFGMSLGCSQPLTMMLMFSMAEEGRAGETVGLRLTVNNIARLVGPALFGAVGSAIGLLAVFWINGTLMGVGGKLSHPAKDRRIAKH